MSSAATWQQYRTVVLDHGAQEVVDREQADRPRFEDQWRGVEWKLARSPQGGVPRFGSEPTRFLVYVFPKNAIAKTCELWVLYSYNDTEVQVHMVNAVSDDESEGQ